MKYVWIVMLAIVELAWWVYTILDVAVCIIINKKECEKTSDFIFDTLEDINGLAYMCIIIHICVVFLASILMYVNG